MKTRVFESHQAEEAAELIRQGKLLAIPTETVYGLGADGLNSKAVAKIFAAKGRPEDNPLILHIADGGWMKWYCRDLPPEAGRLAAAFWPGPLTLIVKRGDRVPDIVTAGLDTVGIRCPDHPVARAVISAAGVPIAAPSANRSGRPSPTTAAHVLEDMDGLIDGLIDGGPCTVGVESTILDLTCVPPRLLRPGGVALEALKEVLGEIVVDDGALRTLGEGETARAPGMKYRHYAPSAPVTVVRGDPDETAAYIALHAGSAAGILCFDEYVWTFDGYKVILFGSKADKHVQARRLFDALRAFDEAGVTEIWAQCPDDAGLGLAIANRLSKAAGFRVVEVPQ